MNLKIFHNGAVEEFLTSSRNEFSAFAEKLCGECYEQAVTLIRESQAKGGRRYLPTGAIRAERRRLPGLGDSGSGY